MIDSDNKAPSIQFNCKPVSVSLLLLMREMKTHPEAITTNRLMINPIKIFVSNDIFMVLHFKIGLK
jgi:hypothetical protein